jgi:CubicO group peptidase (beta-lactamase class C family)
MFRDHVAAAGVQLVAVDGPPWRRRWRCLPASPSTTTSRVCSSCCPPWRCGSHPRRTRCPKARECSCRSTYTFDGSSRNLHALLGGTHTAALLVLKDGVVRYEDYWFTGGRDAQWLSMSVTKSFVSALVGIALAEG